MKKIIISTLAIILAAFLSSGSVLAQQNSNNDPPTNNTKVATVNIDQAQILEKNNNNFVLDFTVSNQNYLQDNIKYGIKLQESRTDQVMDFKVYEETLSLDRNSKLNKKISYKVPEFLKGDYEITLLMENTSGLPLASKKLGNVKLNGNGNYVNIYQNNCRFRVIRDGREYQALLAGSKFQKDDQVKIECTLDNKTGETFSVSPDYEIYQDSFFGEELSGQLNMAPVKVQNLQGDEKFITQFEMPLIQEPGSYVGFLKLKNQNNQIVSNKMGFSYAIKGKRADILNVKLDKTQYNQGDIIGVNILWSKSSQEDEELEAPKLALEIKDKNGQNCIAPKEYPVQDKGNNLSVNLIAQKDCQNPVAMAKIVSGQGDLLSDYKYQVQEQEQDQDQDSRMLAIILVTLILLALAFLIYLIAKKMKKKGIKLLLSLFLSCSLLFSFVVQAKAFTYEGIGGSGAVPLMDINVTPSLSQDPNNPTQLNYGDTIKIESGDLRSGNLGTPIGLGIPIFLPFPDPGQHPSGASIIVYVDGQEVGRLTDLLDGDDVTYPVGLCDGQVHEITYQTDRFEYLQFPPGTPVDLIDSIGNSGNPANIISALKDTPDEIEIPALWGLAGG
ncbi:MAG: hypothetical protein GF335_04015, partial [Candidatus Moranbacteria bacterium]|nr:hypothetical protein [Candidatus Moranbacteria bacterium]